MLIIMASPTYCGAEQTIISVCSLKPTNKESLSQ